MPIYRVHLHLQADVLSDDPADAVHDVSTLVKTQLARIPRSVFEWTIKTITAETLEKKPPQQTTARNK